MGGGKLIWMCVYVTLATHFTRARSLEPATWRSEEQFRRLVVRLNARIRAELEAMRTELRELRQSPYLTPQGSATAAGDYPTEILQELRTMKHSLRTIAAESRSLKTAFINTCGRNRGTQSRHQRTTEELRIAAEERFTVATTTTTPRRQYMHVARVTPKPSPWYWSRDHGTTTAPPHASRGRLDDHGPRDRVTRLYTTPASLRPHPELWQTHVESRYDGSKGVQLTRDSRDRPGVHTGVHPGSDSRSPFINTDYLTLNPHRRNSSNTVAKETFLNRDDLLFRNKQHRTNYPREADSATERHEGPSSVGLFSRRGGRPPDAASDYRFRFDAILTSPGDDAKSGMLRTYSGRRFTRRSRKLPVLSIPFDFSSSRYKDQCPSRVTGFGPSRQVLTTECNVIGTWTKDGATIWVVEGVNAQQWDRISEYSHQGAFVERKPHRVHVMESSCTGLGIAVLDNVLYCQSSATRTWDYGGVMLLKQSLVSDKVLARRRMRNGLLDDHGVPYRGWAGLHLRLQFMVDEKALWLAAGQDKTRKLLLLQLDRESLRVENIIETEHRKDQLGPAFMRCGILYALDSHRGNYVSYVYDTNKGHHDVMSSWQLPMVGSDVVALQYDPGDELLRVWRIKRVDEDGVRRLGGSAEVMPLTCTS